MRAIVGERLATGGCRIEEPCAVEVRRKAKLARGDHLARVGVRVALWRMQLRRRLRLRRMLRPMLVLRLWPWLSASRL